MNVFIINTPYHMFIASTMIKKKDIVVIVDDFDLNNSRFCKLLLNKAMKDNKIYIIKSLRSFGKNLFKLKVYISKIVFDIIQTINQNFINDIILFNDGHPMNQIFINNIIQKKDIILIEEGIGLYRYVKKRYHFIYSLIGKLIFGIRFENTTCIGEQSRTTKIMCNYPKLLNNIQLKKKVERINQWDFSILKNMKDLYAIDQNFNKIPDHEFNIFIGQPLVEDGIINEKEYMKLISTVVRLSTKKNNLFIKPHPRENISKYFFMEEEYGAILLRNKDIPIELLLLDQKKARVFTAYSSAVFNIAKYFRINSYLLYKLIDFNPKIPCEMLKSSYINVVENFKELSELKGKITHENQNSIK
ncbi:hypothetical protein SAMN05660462_00594 [Proteiniborus ethanoligenes]|uniref:Glycosyltransferase family 52 n=1 Tax=Proteiniborus ethanoligenes TaxID=415015 RepID=A0A1H3LQF1_9FIRM|nr:polysialyltransferase family glycosyltransferase [Proteiniborus ethanoligenes]SDY66550.1 hypothetical protein SAMN05660462_00594 [Proteiniborus ethanoligenes]